MTHASTAETSVFQSDRRVEAPAAWWEKALAIIGLLIVCETFRILLFSANDRTEGSALYQLASGGVYLAAIAAVLIRGVPVWAMTMLARAWPLLVLTFMPLVSTIWSQAPEPTLRRAVALLLSSAFAMFMVIRFDLRTFFNLLATTFAIFIVVGIAAAAMPGVGITPGGAYAGAWRGLSGQKNVFARTLALAVALLPAAVMVGLAVRRKIWLLLAFVALVLLVMARSATALAAAFGGLSIGAALYAALGGRVGRVRLRPELGIAFLAIAAASGALIVTFGWTPILEALGRDATLTGRTNLWRWATQLNPDQAWLGSGYRAFWIDSNTKYFFEFFWWRLSPDGARSDTFAGPEHAHSGYIDTRLELGWLGIGMFVLMICSALVQLRRVLVHGNSQVGFIFAVILSFLLIYAITERSILQRSEDLWFLFTALYLFLLRGAPEKKPTNED